MIKTNKSQLLCGVNSKAPFHKLKYHSNRINFSSMYVHLVPRYATHKHGQFAARSTIFAEGKLYVCVCAFGSYMIELIMAERTKLIKLR